MKTNNATDRQAVPRTVVRGHFADQRAAHDLHLVIDTIPAMAWIVLPDGKLDFINRPWLEYSGLSLEQALADPMATIHPDDLPGVQRRWEDHVARGLPYQDEMRLRRADGVYRWFLVRTVALRDKAGNIVRWYGTSSDIEDRVQAEQALRKSERLLREAQELGHTGSWEQDLITGTIVNTDENTRLFFGDDRSKGARLEDYVEAIHPDDRAYVEQRRARLLGEAGPREIEFRVVWPNGEIHVLQGLATVVRDATGRPVRVYGTNLDITERRRAERTIRAHTERLQALTRRLVEVQETERRELSRELHDRVGQTLTAMRINLDLIRNRVPADDSTSRDRIDDSRALLQSAFDAVKDVMYELRPPMLEDQSLAAPLKWYARKFADRTGIDVQVKAGDGWRCEPAVELALFRIAQEALTNVARHSKATRVAVALSPGSDHISLTIEDNGVGIPASGPREQPGYGFITMRERAESVGGTLAVESPAAGGTRIVVRAPANCERGIVAAKSANRAAAGPLPRAPSGRRPRRRSGTA
jgi:PAS domain S-box-containing protein